MQTTILLLEGLIQKTKDVLTLLNDAYVPLEVKLSKLSQLLRYAISVEYAELRALEQDEESVFQALCTTIINRSTAFLENPEVQEGRDICLLILSINNYLVAYEKTPWRVGKKITSQEAANLRSLFRKTFHEFGNPRGQVVFVELAGSLARGFSDYKHISDIPKPSDYDLPREVRKAVDAEISIHQKLKSKFSDVDIVIVNQALYDSISHQFHRPWVKLGEKYPEGMGGSQMLAKIHEKLSRAKIAGISGRWINFVICRDMAYYEQYVAERKRTIALLLKTEHHPVELNDLLILNEIVT